MEEAAAAMIEMAAAVMAKMAAERTVIMAVVTEMAEKAMADHNDGRGSAGS
jgi:hypothetical protein